MFWSSEGAEPPLLILNGASQPPVVTLDTPGDGESFGSDEAVPVGASAFPAGSVIASTELFVNGLPASESSVPDQWNLSALASGWHVLTVIAADAVGRVGSETIRISVALAGDFETWRDEVFPPEQRRDEAISGRDRDPDGDRLTNEGEFLAGTDPLDANSALVLTEFRRAATGTGYEVRWQSVAGRVYELETSPDLTPGSWTTRLTPVSFSTSTRAFLSELMVAQDRFVRIRVSPPQDE